MNTRVISLIVLAVLFTVPLAAGPCDCKCPRGCIDRQAAIEYLDSYLEEHPELSEEQVDALRSVQVLHQMDLDGQKPEGFQSLVMVVENNLQEVFWWWEMAEIFQPMRDLRYKCDELPDQP